MHSPNVEAAFPNAPPLRLGITPPFRNQAQAPPGIGKVFPMERRLPRNERDAKSTKGEVSPSDRAAPPNLQDIPSYSKECPFKGMIPSFKNERYSFKTKEITF